MVVRCKMRKFRPFLLTVLCTTMLVVYNLYQTLIQKQNDDLPQLCYGNLLQLFPAWEDQQVILQPVGENGSESYVYSAYIDDRPAPDIDSQTLPVVRVLTWFRRAEQQHVVRHWRCLLWFDQLNSPFEVPVVIWTDLSFYDTESRIMPAFTICQYPATHHTKVVAVSLVTSHCLRPTNVIQLIDLRQELDHITDKEARRRSGPRYPVNFTICVHSPFFGTLYTASDLLEFVEVNRMFGAERFVLYVEPTSIDRQLLTCLERYQRLGVVELRHWSLPADIADDVHYHGQILAMNDCLYRAIYVTKYLALHDLDEFIVPQRTTNWNDMIRSINSQVPDPEAIASYSFRNRFFPLRLPDVVDQLTSSLSATADVRKYRLKTLSKAMTHAGLYPHKERSKLITRPEHMTAVHVHEVLPDRMLAQQSRWSSLSAWRRWLWTKLSAVSSEHLFVNEDDAQLFHYREVNVVNMTLLNITRMREFSAKILQRFLMLNLTK